MKKRNNFIRTIPAKLYILLAAIVVLSFFFNDFGLVDIQKTAVILAAGVDRSEEGYTLTAQIAVPKGTDRTTGGTSSVNIEGTGETVSECVAQIYTKTGWVPKLVFCNLIVLGEETAKDDALAALDYFLRNEYMPDSCLLAVSEGKAGELLSSASAIDDTSSLAIGNLFSDAAKKSGRVEPNTLREFAIGCYGVSSCGFLPYIRTFPQATEQDGGSQSAAGTESGEGGQGGQAEQKDDIYQATETAIFSDGKMVSLLTEDQTFALSLLNGNVFSGTVTAQDGAPVTLTVLRNKGGVSLDMKGAPVAKLNVSLRVRVYNRGDKAQIDDIARSEPSKTLLQNAQEQIDEAVRSLWDAVRQSGCDLFELKKSLYRSSLKQYAEWKDSLLSIVTPEIRIQLKGVK